MLAGVYCIVFIMKTYFYYFILPYFEKQRQVNLEIFNLFAAVWPDTVNIKKLKMHMKYKTVNNWKYVDLTNIPQFKKHIFSTSFALNNLNEFLTNFFIIFFKYEAQSMLTHS